MFVVNINYIIFNRFVKSKSGIFFDYLYARIVLLVPFQNLFFKQITSF